MKERILYIMLVSIFLLIIPASAQVPGVCPEDQDLSNYVLNTTDACYSQYINDLSNLPCATDIAGECASIAYPVDDWNSQSDCLNDSSSAKTDALYDVLSNYYTCEFYSQPCVAGNTTTFNNQSYYCSGSTWVAGKEQGQTCSANAQCSSNQCSTTCQGNAYSNAPYFTNVGVNNLVANPGILPQYTVALGSHLIFSVTASNPVRSALNYSVSNMPTGAVFTPSSGTFSWTPATGQNGTFTVLFTATISQGQAGAGLTGSIPVIIISGNGVNNKSPVWSGVIQLPHTVTNNPAINFSAVASETGGLGVSLMQFSTDASHWGALQAYSNSASYTLPAGDGAKTIYARFKDVAGNYSGIYSSPITLDTTPPTGSFTINGGASSTNSLTVNLNLSATDNLTGVIFVEISNDGLNWTQKLYSSTVPWNLPANSVTGSSQTIYVKFVDGAGNLSSAYSKSIILTAQIPTAPTTVSALAGKAQAIVSFSGDLANGSPITGYTVTSSPGSITATGTASPITVNNLTIGTPYTFTVTATNSVGPSIPSKPSNSVIPLAAVLPVILSATPQGPQDFTFSLNITLKTNEVATCKYVIASGAPGAPSLTPFGSLPNTFPTNDGINFQQSISAIPAINNYQYWHVNCMDQAGHTMPSDYILSFVVKPPLAPSTPTLSLVLSTNGKNNILSWNASTTAAGTTVVYNIFRSTQLTPFASTSSTTWTDTSASLGTTYAYYVTAFVGLPTTPTSAASNTVTGAIPGLPKAPTTLSAVAGNTQATVTFSGASPNGSAITSYKVTSTPGAITATGSSSPITVTGLTNGTAYTFKVEPINIIGPGTISVASNSVTPKAGVPTPPAIGTVVAGDGKVTVSFSGALPNGSPITSYTVTSSPGGKTATGASSPLTVTGLTNGTAYTFTVTATNGVGTGGASMASTSVTPAGLPLPPTIVSAQARASATQVLVTFSGDSGNGSLITSYTVTSSPGGLTGTVSPSGLASNIKIFTGLTAGTSYTFTVTATNSIGTSVSSVASNPVIPGVPLPPTIGTALAGNGQAVVTFSPGTAVASATTGYTVTSSSGGKTATGASSPITITGLNNGTAYSFTVTATNSYGTGAASAASNSVIPLAPSCTASKFTIMATAATGVTISPSGSLQVTCGSNPIFTITTPTCANGCSSVSTQTIIDGGTPSFSITSPGSTINYTFPEITASHTIAVSPTDIIIGSILINNGSISTTSHSVTLTLAASDNYSSVINMAISNTSSSGPWTTVAYATSYAWALPASLVNGSQTIYIKFQNVAGTWSPVYSASIILDNIIGSIVINGGVGYSASSVVTLTLNATDSPLGVQHMAISNDNTNWTTVTYATSYSWNLPASLATGSSQTVYVKFESGAGNWSGQSSAAVLYDTLAGTRVIQSVNWRTATQGYSPSQVAYDY